MDPLFSSELDETSISSPRRVFNAILAADDDGVRFAIAVVIGVCLGLLAAAGLAAWLGQG